MGTLVLLMTLGAALAVSWWERVRPARPPAAPAAATSRWVASFGLYVCCQLLPLLPIWPWLQAWAAAGSIFTWPGSVAGDGPLRVAAGLLLGVLLLDLLGYGMHRALHTSRWLWPLHMAHHSDTDFDVTVAFRFHPLEAMLSSALRTVMAAALGLPLAALLAYAVINALHNAVAHANASLPQPLERWVSRLLVTPDLHRVHHALDPQLACANFGIVFSVWDRVFGSRRCCAPGEPSAFGVPALNGQAPLSLAGLLALPFRRRRPAAPGTARDPLQP